MEEKQPGFFQAVQIYYRQHGFLSAVRRSIEVSADYASKFLMDVVLMLSGDVFFERYFLQDRGILAQMNKTKGLKIGIAKVGGLGDALTTTAMVGALKKKWPDAHIYLFIRTESQRQFLSRDKNIEKVVVVSKKVDLSAYLKEAMAKNLTKKHLDIFFMHRYVVKAYLRKGTYPELKKKWDELFKRYNINFHLFPYFTNNLLFFKKNEYELSSACTDLHIEPSAMSLVLEDEDYKILKGLPESFITVHHGADSESVAPLRGKENIQTKNWFVDRWARVTGFLKSKGYEVIQLGVPSDEYIPGTVDMRGRTNLTQAGAILKKAVLHLDTEGGLVHFARAVGTRSIVLFGPTAIEFYGYKDNINIRAGECRSCWWSKPDWQYLCPMGHAISTCMDSISVEIVTNALENSLPRAAENEPH